MINNNISYSNANVKGKIKDIAYKNIKVYLDGECDVPSITFEALNRDNFIDNVLIENLDCDSKINIKSDEYCYNIKIN